jgi:hypothetical protein
MPSKPYPHPEERPKGVSRRTQGRYAALRPNSCPVSALFRPTAVPGVKCRLGRRLIACAIEAVGPQMGSAQCVDQLSGNTHATARFAHRSFRGRRGWSWRERSSRATEIAEDDRRDQRGPDADEFESGPLDESARSGAAQLWPSRFRTEGPRRVALRPCRERNLSLARQLFGPPFAIVRACQRCEKGERSSISCSVRARGWMSWSR